METTNNDSNDSTPEAAYQGSAEITPPAPLPPPPKPAPPAPAVSQQMVAKSPPLAAFLGILPGLGHLYAGTYQRAAMVVIAFLLPFFLEPPVLPWVIWCLFVWFFAIIDAYRQAQIANLPSDEPQPKPTRRGQGGLAFGVFLTVVGAILLIDRFYPIDLYWLRNWWPAALVIAGIWVIIVSVRERTLERRQHETFDYDREVGED